MKSTLFLLLVVSLLSMLVPAKDRLELFTSQPSEVIHAQTDSPLLDDLISIVFPKED